MTVSPFQEVQQQFYGTMRAHKFVMVIDRQKNKDLPKDMWTVYISEAYLNVKPSFSTGFNKHDAKVLRLAFPFLYQDLPVP